jgi:hypothetical protein
MTPASVASTDASLVMTAASVIDDTSVRRRNRYAGHG